MSAYLANGNYPLNSCLWELTLRCNMRCLHCGSSAGRARTGELTLGECFAVVDELAALECAELTFIGGEIFLYRGWEQIARSASDRGIIVNIMTNAFGIGEDEVRQIQHARLSNVGISLDGMEENHNLIRGRNNSFAKIVEAFDLLNRSGIPTAVVTSLLESNFPDLEKLYEFLLGHGVQIWQLQLVNPMGNMAGRKDLILSPGRVAWLIGFIREKNCERRMTVVAADNIGYYHDETEGCIRGRRQAISYWAGCQAGLTSVFIDSVGNVKGCGALYDPVFIEGNLRDRCLGEIWRDEGKFKYNRAFDLQSLTGACRDCFAADVCKGGCRASNYFNLGTLYESAYCPHAGVNSLS